MKELTKAEEEVMQVLWSIEKGFVKDILQAFNEPKPAYNTISTIVRILEKKGFVAYKAYGKSHQYYPALSKEEYRSQLSDSLLSKYFGGSVENLVSFFVKKGNLDVKELDDILQEMKSKKK